MDKSTVEKVEVFEDKSGQWRWRAWARNSEIVADSAEGYTRYADAHRAAAHVFPVGTKIEKGVKE